MDEKVMKGSTPTHSFDIGFNTETVAEVRVSYAQDNKEILKKCKDDCSLDGQSVSCVLSQEETMLFDCEKKLFVQIKVKTLGGEVLVSDPIQLQVGRCFNGEVI